MKRKRWFSFDSENADFEFFETEAEAKKAAEGYLGFYRDNAGIDGWPEDETCVGYGKVVALPVKSNVKTRRPQGPRGCGRPPTGPWPWPDFDETYNLTLEPIAAPLLPNPAAPDPRDDGELCERCGKRYLAVYRVSDSVWLEIMGEAPSGLLCVECCDHLAREASYALYWEAADEHFPTEPAPDPRREELAAWLERKAVWYKLRAESSRSAHGVREIYRVDAECAETIAALLRGGR